MKACGSGALLAGRAAAHLWGLIRAAPPQPEVLAPGDRRISGLIVHRARHTELRDVAEHRGIPLTSVPRTLVDIASSLPGPALGRACHQAGVRYGTTPRQVEGVLEESGLPLPVTNKAAGGRRVDCRWPEHRVTIELDSYRFHNSRHSWERDRLRERETRMRGNEFRRYSWADVFEKPAYMLKELRDLLG